MLRSGRSASGFDSHHPDHGVIQLGIIKYFVKGKNPKLLIRSGSHGDEYEIIQALKLVVGAWEKRLPDFVFIPEVSPSAVSRKTRLNERGVDLNRQFFDNSTEPEAVDNMKIVHQFSFDLCFDFHEDLDLTAFYMYDSGDYGQEKLDKLKSGVRKLGIDLFTGVDDPSDPTLAIQIDDGYFPHSEKRLKPVFGMFEIWALSKGLLKRGVVPEIPGKIPFAKKEALVELIIKELILNQ